MSLFGWFVIFVVGGNIYLAEGRIVAAAVIPHGDFAYDPGLVHNANGSLEIHKSAVAVGELIVDLAPDLILLSTPHGIELSVDFAVYQNTNGSGYALVGQDLHNASFPLIKVPLNASLAPNQTAFLVDALQYSQNVSGMLAFADTQPIQLGWGEVIPLTFLGPLITDLSSSCHTIIWSQPTRRYTQSVQMIPELLNLGHILSDLLENSEELKHLRTVVIISADLAHTFEASGPYGYNPFAEPFDNACALWAQSLNRTELVVEAAQYVDSALSCGYTGMVMLQGILERRGVWTPQLWAMAHPTYYGMMVATFIRDE